MTKDVDSAIKREYQAPRLEHAMQWKPLVQAISLPIGVSTKSAGSGELDASFFGLDID